MALDKGFNKVDGYDYIGEDYKEIGNYASSEKTYQKMIAVFTIIIRDIHYKHYFIIRLKSRLQLCRKISIK